MNEQKIILRAVKAVENLLAKQGDLVRRDLHERTITHWLAVYLQKEFKKHHVDCEYNQNGDHGKTYLAYVGYDLTERVPLDDKGFAKTAYPDVIVHKRETNAGNLLVVEAKKTDNPNRARDEAKIRAFLDPNQPPEYDYSYALALVLELRCGPQFGASLTFKRAEGNEIIDVYVACCGEHPPD
jgi:hypothetical protein